jgi:hypothetical protein
MSVDIGTSAGVMIAPAHEIPSKFMFLKTAMYQVHSSTRVPVVSNPSQVASSFKMALGILHTHLVGARAAVQVCKKTTKNQLNNSIYNKETHSIQYCTCEI